jgi:hypothetical protein
MKLADFNKKLKQALETLSKAREDAGLSPDSKRRLRTSREKFSSPDPLDRVVSQVRPGVSDVGIEARRADPKQTGVISHGYARVLEPHEHAGIAKVKAKKILEKLRQQKPLDLPKTEKSEIILLEKSDGTAELFWGEDVADQTIDLFIKTEMSEYEETSDLEKEEKPFHGYNKKKHSKSGGLNDSYRKKYNKETGSDLKRPVTGKVKPGSKAAKRRKSFCARMSGVKGPTSKDGKLTPRGAALKRWKCNKTEDLSKRCWEGYAPVPGKKPYSKGSCAKVKKAAPDIVNPKDPVLNYDKKGPQAMPESKQKQMAAKILKFMKKKSDIAKAEADLKKNKYLKEMMHQMKAEKQAKRDAALKQFQASKAPQAPKVDAPAPAAPTPQGQKLFDPDLSGTAPTPFQAKQAKIAKANKAAIGPRVYSEPVEINRETFSEPLVISGPTPFNSDDSDKKVLGNLMSKLKKLKRS